MLPGNPSPHHYAAADDYSVESTVPQTISLATVVAFATEFNENLVLFAALWLVIEESINRATDVQASLLAQQLNILFLNAKTQRIDETSAQHTAEIAQLQTKINSMSDTLVRLAKHN